MLDASEGLKEVAPAPLTAASIREKWARGLPALRNEAHRHSAWAEGHPAAALHRAGRVRRGRERAPHPGRYRRQRYRRGFAARRFAREKSESHSNQRAAHGVLARSGVADWRAGQCAVGASPFVHRPSSIVDRRWTIDMDDLWDRGYCPFCGSWPAFIEAHDGAHTLRCSYCALGWSLHSHRCVYCGNAGEDFVAAAPDVSRPQRRVELCGKCSGYTKVIDVQEPAPFPLLAIADLATISLDEGAMNRGYRRPELFDLDAIEPRDRVLGPAKAGHHSIIPVSSPTLLPDPCAGCCRVNPSSRWRGNRAPRGATSLRACRTP